MSFISLFKSVLLLLITATSAVPLDEHDGPADIDVAIVGGGSAGTYAAVRLLDQGKTVALIEQKDRLGGHTETYVDPTTGAKIDIGVQAWYNNDIVKAYFSRLNVSLVTAKLSGGAASIPITFRAGQFVSNYMPADPTATLGAYGAQLAKYPYLENGYYLPSPVPEDLLLPFGQFVTKYDLGPAVFTIFSFNQGQGDLLNAPTLYVFKLFSLGVLNGVVNGFVTTASHDNSELYRNAQAFLGSSVYLNTKVAAINRSSSRVRLSLNTPNGPRTLAAKKLLVAVPPLLSNLAGFDTSPDEAVLFSQFRAHTYETGILHNTGLPANGTFRNIDPSRPYTLPDLPGVYVFSNTGIPNLVSFKYGANSRESITQAQSSILADLDRVRSAVGVKGSAKAEFAVYSSHQPFELEVGVDAIRNGFYDNLYALQGKRNTFYTGAAWQAHDSSALWQFTEKLLANITA